MGPDVELIALVIVEPLAQIFVDQIVLADAQVVLEGVVLDVLQVVQQRAKQAVWDVLDAEALALVFV